VTQTEVPNIVKNPTFTNHLGGGSSENWSIQTCPGGCAFSPTEGFKPGNGGTITQDLYEADLFGNVSPALTLAEKGQGMTFSFGAEVDNNQAGNNLPDTWSIKLELFNISNVQLGDAEIGSTEIFGPTIKTGNLEIDSGNRVYRGVLTLFGDSALNGGSGAAPFFNDVFTTYMYNNIETSITTATTYSELITTISCEVLDSCAAAPVDTVELVTTIIPTEVSVNTEVAIAAPITIASIAELPTPTIPVATVETVQEVAEVASIETEIGGEIEINTEESGSSNPAAKLRAETKGKKSDVKQKAVVKKKAMSKAGNKVVKKMGNKKYSNTNQIKTLVIMQVLGNTRSFFDAQVQLKDTPNFFSNTTIPDKSISDNNYTSYFLFGGSDSDHDALIESQYRR